MTDPKDALIVGCKALLRQIEAKDALISRMAAALRDCLPQITITTNGAYCNGCCRGADTPEAIKHKASCDHVTIAALLASDAAQKALAEREVLLRDKRRIDWLNDHPNDITYRYSTADRRYWWCNAVRCTFWEDLRAAIDDAMGEGGR